MIRAFDETGRPPDAVAQGEAAGVERGVFKRAQNALPPRELGYYIESDVWPGPAGRASADRLVFGRGGEVYYSPDHYGRSIRIR